jgi:hypothetical protein
MSTQAKGRRVWQERQREAACRDAAIEANLKEVGYGG